MKAIRISATGGPEVMQLVDVPETPPGPGEALVRHRAIGVNFIDTYYRSGLYPMPLPGGIGGEAAGVVEAVGEGVSHLRPGDRVVYFAPQPGSYAEARTLDARWLAKLPDDVDFDTAAAIWLKGCTVEMLVARAAEVQAGQWVLVPAAAGGVGVPLCQWLKSVGATVIGVTSPGKTELARQAGADHVIGYEDLPAKVRELTGGRGVDAVIDGVGKATFADGLQSLRPRGRMLSFGNASGAVGAFDLALLQRGGSLWATRPVLFDYYRDPADFAAGAEAVFAKVRAGVLKPHIGRRAALAEAADVHRALAARETEGATLLIP